MGTIIDYVKEYGDIPFSEMPFNEVDSLVLCQFVYLKFEHLVGGIADEEPFVSLCELDTKKEKGNLFADTRYERDNRALYESMLSGCRFHNLKMNYYVNQVDLEKETQFSAITFLLENGMVYVAYRGTDETMVGWKEDCNFFFPRPVPGQIKSVLYLELIARYMPNKLYVGGHSKGGNLAVYASLRAKPKIRERIKYVYSYDSPGFHPDVISGEDYGVIGNKFTKFIPQASIVGKLLEDSETYEMVESSAHGLIQHNPYTWQVKGTELVRVKERNDEKRIVEHTLNAWLLSMEEEQLREMIHVLFRVLEASDTDNLIDLGADWKRSMKGILAEIKKIEEPARKRIRGNMQILFRMARDRTMAQMQKKTEMTLEKISKKAEESKQKIAEKVKRK